LVTPIERNRVRSVYGSKLAQRCGDLLARKKSAAMTETVPTFVPSRSRFFYRCSHFLFAKMAELCGFLPRKLLAALVYGGAKGGR
jgi:hypothetical protein